MALIIEQLKNDEIKITPETQLDLIFWTNIKSQLNTQEAEIKALKRELNIATQELSYLKKESEWKEI